MKSTKKRRFLKIGFFLSLGDSTDRNTSNDLKDIQDMGNSNQANSNKSRFKELASKQTPNPLAKKPLLLGIILKLISRALRNWLSTVTGGILGVDEVILSISGPMIDWASLIRGILLILLSLGANELDTLKKIRDDLGSGRQDLDVQNERKD